MRVSQRFAFLLIAPSLVFVGLFTLFPIVESFRLSFYRLILAMPWLGEKMIGLENYTDLLTDPVAMESLKTTSVFVVASVALELLIGLAIALMMNEALRGRSLLRAIVLIPWAMPTVVSAQMWRFLFNDRYGLITFLAFGSGSGQYPAVLADPSLAFLAVIVAEVWKTAPFAGLILLAGFQVIPDDLYEAGTADGATGWQMFRGITLPLLKPALLLALLFRTIDALRVFDLVFVMTQGGPADATNFLQFYGYKKTFAEGMIGYGSAIAVTVFLLSAVLSLAYLRLFTRAGSGPR